MTPVRLTPFVVASALSALSATFSTGSLAQTPQIANPAVPLSVVMRPNGDNVDIEITNHGAKTASAWSIKSERPRPDGRPDTVGLTSDVYPLLVIPAKHPIGRRPIPPGASMIVESFPASAYPEALWTPAAVVYEDGTSAGEEKRIAEIFKRRSADAHFWKEVSALFEQVIRTEITPASVRHAKEQIEAREANAQGDGQSRGKTVADNLERVLQSPSTLDSALKAYAATVAKYAEGSAAHAIRR